MTTSVSIATGGLIFASIDWQGWGAGTLQHNRWPLVWRGDAATQVCQANETQRCGAAAFTGPMGSSDAALPVATGVIQMCRHIVCKMYDSCRHIVCKICKFVKSVRFVRFVRFVGYIGVCKNGRFRKKVKMQKSEI